MPSHDPTDVELTLDGKTHYLRSTPFAMRGISQMLGGYHGALNALVNMHVEAAITLISFGIGKTKPKEVEAINEALYRSGGIEAIYPALEEYLVRVFHGGNMPAHLQKTEGEGGDLGGKDSVDLGGEEKENPQEH